MPMPRIINAELTSVCKTWSLQTQRRLLLGLRLFSKLSCLTTSHSFAGSLTVPGSLCFHSGEAALGSVFSVLGEGTQATSIQLELPPLTPTKFTCKDAVARILASRSSSSATTDLLWQWMWSAHSCLPRLCCCCCCCGALPERAAPAHWVTLWQSLKT